MSNDQSDVFLDSPANSARTLEGSFPQANLSDLPTDHSTVALADPSAAATVARGEMLLAMLSQQAAAARAEANCAELRMLLAAAHAGQTQPLAHWLDTHQAGESQHAMRSRSAHSSSPVPPRGSTLAITSWEQLLPATRARLRQRAAEQWAAEQPTAAQQTPVQPANEPRSKTQQVKAQQVKAPARDVARKSAATPVEPKTATRKPSPKFAEKFTPQQLKNQQAQQCQQRRGRRVRGLLASFAAHVGLGLLLAFITLRLPRPPASLALDFSPSEATTDSFEISQPLEVDPTQVVADPQVAVEAFDVSESLADVTATVSNSLNEFSTADQSLMAAALSGTAASPAGSMARGINQNATFFGAAASGNSFCYVIDGSESMRNGPWDAAKAELLKSLASLKSKQRFYVIFFNRELSAIPLPGERQPAPYTLYATAENLLHARRWIDSLRIDFGDPPKDALELAISKEPDAIYLLTDGVTKADVLGFLRQHNRVQDVIFGEQVRVPIHTIAFYSLEGQELLQQIAAENNGQYIYVPNPKRR